MDSEKRYKLMVKKGKELAEEIRSFDKKIYECQIKVAKMALAVCNIRHGGYSKDYYTIKDYAVDIGLVHKTVQEWVAVYRNVVIKLDSEINSSKDWSNARATNDMLAEERRNINKDAGKPKSRHAYKQRVPKEKVNDIFKSLSTGVGQFMKTFLNVTKSAKYANGVIKNNNLDIISDRELISLIEILNETSEIINRHLVSKARKRA